MRKQFQKLRFNQKGFTLIELMAVLAILAMIVLIAVPAVGSILAKAEEGSADAHISMIEHAAGLAHVGASVNPAPGELEKKDSYTAKELVDGGYLNADLSPEDEDIVVTKQPSGNFSAAPGGEQSLGEELAERLFRILTDAADVAYAAGFEPYVTANGDVFYDVSGSDLLAYSQADDLMALENTFAGLSEDEILEFEQATMTVLQTKPGFDPTGFSGQNYYAVLQADGSFDIAWLSDWLTNSLIYPENLPH